MMFCALSYVAIFGLLLSATASTPADFLVSNLPLFSNPPPFRHYAGQIPVNVPADVALAFGVDDVSTQNIFFWFFESQKNGTSDPVMLWLNGGPGCSSMFGALDENGPFQVTLTGNSTVSVSLNPYAWNREANLLIIDSPSGVGFSYGGNLTTGDNQTALYSTYFLQEFFNIFTTFQGREFYVAGESYAGVYVPMLVNSISTLNSKLDHAINVRGWMAGNPSGLVTDNWTPILMDFWYYRGFVSEAQYVWWGQQCNVSTNNCSEAYVRIYNESLHGVNPYDIYASCAGAGPGNVPGCFTQNAFAVAASADAATFMDADFVQGAGFRAQANRMVHDSQTFVPCFGTSALAIYLNRTDVRAALHVSPETPAWVPCSQVINYAQFVPRTVIANIYNTYAEKLRVLVYSGDVDSCVPWVITRAGVEALNQTLAEPVHQWLYVDPAVSTGWSQVGGFVWKYTNGLNFITVRGAGHMVPHYAPVAAYYMLDHFLRGVPY